MGAFSPSEVMRTSDVTLLSPLSSARRIEMVSSLSCETNEDASSSCWRWCSDLITLEFAMLRESRESRPSAMICEFRELRCELLASVLEVASEGVVQWETEDSMLRDDYQLLA